MARVLVVGGAGYVGSATCAWLTDHGHEVWVLDDLSTGHYELLICEKFFYGRCGDEALVKRILSQKKADCVMHFAARSLVSESVQKPIEYHENNVVQTQKLIGALLSSGVKNFIFSSTCAIFGDAGERDIVESLPKNPQSPYGQTKLDVEKFLENEAKQWGLRSIALRYFNAAGAEPKLRAGEWHLAESHLIPRVLQAAVEDRAIEIFGTDYPTSDGTCIRDYIHVWDLAAAHGMAMQRLLDLEDSQKGSFEAFNLGSESGVSVRKMVATCEEVVGKKLRVEEKPRRAGDPSRLVANSSLARKVLGFGHGALDLKAVVSSAWEWEKKRVTLLRKAIFLDRDGTLNEDPGYLRDPAQIKLLPEVGEALALLKGLGFLLVVVTNQSGIGRGLIQTSALPLIHKRLDELLKPYVSKIDLYQICPHHPDDRCECRKPKPKLILDAAHILGIDVSRSYMIGDKSGDLGAGFAAGCKASILVRTGEGATTASQLQEGQATWIADSLLQAGNWILSEENAAL